MGNSESSSQFPPPGDRGNNRRPDRFRANRAEEEEEAASSSSLGTALKVGAAVTGGALLTLGALSLASSSDSAEPNQRRKSRMEEYHEVEGLGGKSGRGFSPADGFRQRGYDDVPSVPRIIKIMSYNIWGEQVQVQERMKAIGQLIQLHSPHIILFQEVTPYTYEIFQGSNWWKTYFCSVLPGRATRKHFCVLLSKLPANLFCLSLEKIRYGKELCVACIHVGPEKKLVAATCHLKSPEYSETHHESRMAQAKEALSHLSSLPNVVFGGDMNWVENGANSDGPFPLPSGWVDAWTKLRTGESGWTFDSSSNPMLGSHHPVQERLDRFLCKLKDFRMVSVQMIGMEAIPGISWYNRKALPVLPSDHYGLLLTISAT